MWWILGRFHMPVFPGKVQRSKHRGDPNPPCSAATEQFETHPEEPTYPWCDGLLMCQLIWMLLWRYFVLVIKNHNQFTFSKGDYPGRAWFYQFQGLKIWIPWRNSACGQQLQPALFDGLPNRFQTCRAIASHILAVIYLYNYMCNFLMVFSSVVEPDTHGHRTS